VPSAIAAVCAQEQGKFWELHDIMFANQGALEDADLRRYAGQVGMDLALYDKCIALPATAAKVEKDHQAGLALGITGTPMFFIGESQVRGAQPFDKFKQAIDSELARAG
jgi:protein-disulfide isomerase